MELAVAPGIASAPLLGGHVGGGRRWRHRAGAGGDGAYAGGPSHRAVAERRQALPNAEGVFRPKAPAVRAAARLDSLSARGRHARHVAREGRAAWERATGYGRRNAAEWAFSRLKRVLGGTLRSRSPEAQRVEARVAVSALNRMAELGLPRAQRVA